MEQKPWAITITDQAGRTRQQLRCDPGTGAISFVTVDGALFGVGEGGHPFDAAAPSMPWIMGSTVRSSPPGARAPHPVADRLWRLGIFFAHPWGSFDLSGPNGRFLTSDQTPTRDIFILLADTPAQLLGGWAELTGYTHMPPLRSLGYQQSHRTPGNRQTVLDETKQFRARKLPCDAMIYLGTGFCPAGWNTGHGSFTFNPCGVS